MQNFIIFLLLVVCITQQVKCKLLTNTTLYFTIPSFFNITFDDIGQHNCTKINLHWKVGDMKGWKCFISQKQNEDNLYLWVSSSNEMLPWVNMFVADPRNFRKANFCSVRNSYNYQSSKILRINRFFGNYLVSSQKSYTTTTEGGLFLKIGLQYDVN